MVLSSWRRWFDRPPRPAPRARRATPRRHGLHLRVETLEARLTPAVADLALTMLGPSAANPGDNLTYNITVTNNGPGNAQSVALTDDVPAGTTFVSESQPAGPSFNCTVPSVEATGTVACTIPTLTATQSATFQLVVSVPHGVYRSVIVNSAAITTTSTDPDLTNNSYPVVTTVGPAAALLVQVFGSPSLTAGTNATYTLTVTNTGPSNAQSATLVDAVPGGTTFVSEVPAANATCTDPAPSATGPTPLTCTIPTLPVGQSATFEVVLNVGATTVSVADTAAILDQYGTNAQTVTGGVVVPVQVTLSPNTVADGSPPGTLVGTLSATDMVDGQFFPATYNLLAGESGFVLADPGRNTVLVTQFRACHATQASYPVTVHVQAGLGQQTASFQVNVADAAFDPCLARPDAPVLDSVQVVRAGRQGRPQALVLTFSVALDPGSATGLGHYAIQLGFTGKGTKRKPITAPLLGADPVGRVVTLRLGKVKGPKLLGTLTIEGVLGLDGVLGLPAAVFVDLRPQPSRKH